MVARSCDRKFVTLPQSSRKKAKCLGRFKNYNHWQGQTRVFFIVVFRRGTGTHEGELMVRTVVRPARREEGS